MSNTFTINPKDNVTIALTNENNKLLGHKYALKAIKPGEPIIKYGEFIGIATQDIIPNEHVHTHNTKTALGTLLEYTYTPNLAEQATEPTAPLDYRTVNVYERENGLIGIRNELWIIPTVGCVNGVAGKIINTFKQRQEDKGLQLDKLENFDGIHTFSHPYGCSQMGDDQENTRVTLQNIVKHPNAGGVLILGLGCENNQIQAFMDTLTDYDPQRIRTLIAQESEDEINDACNLLDELLTNLLKDRRTPQPLSVLNIGLECGGSDGLSGITANPLVGRFSDYLISHGGTSVLTEVPEKFGAEHILMNRCVNYDVFQQTVDMINNFKQYYKNHNQVIYNNPSPGNKKGGITTLEDKSLGCITKSGKSPVVDVLKSTQLLKKKGLTLISAPGNDAVATTTLGTCGCHMVLFTTGRGTPFGGFIPTLKIATNNSLATKKETWIDFNTGELIHGTNVDVLLENFIDLIIETVNGKQTKQELNDYREIAIFKSGVTL